MIRPWFSMALIALAVASMLTSCGSSPAQSNNTNPTVDPQVGKGQSAKLNMDEIFPPGPGRSLVLNNCTSCHTITPIVMVQMTREARERWARDHKERVPSLSDPDFKTVTEYLIENFNPSKPVPQLPKELLDSWTSY